MYIAECRAMGIKVLNPDVNRSVTDFAAIAPADVPDGVTLPIGSPGAITFGLSAVRNVGAGLVALLLAERDANGPFASFHDFAERVPEPVLNKRAVESLIKAGAFDSLGHPRKGLLGVFEHVTDTTLTRRRERERGVMSLFGDWGGDTAEPASEFDERLPVPDMEFEKTDKLRHEKEMLGLYVSDHPLFGVEAALRRKVEHSIADLAELGDGAAVTIGGVITGLTRKFTKRGDQMAVFVLEDLESAVEVTLFPRTLIEQGHKLADDVIVAVRGRLDRRDESRITVIGQTIDVLEGLESGPAPTITLRLPATSLDELRIQRLKRILRDHPGTRRCCSTSAARCCVSPTTTASTSTAPSATCGLPSGTTPSCSDRQNLSNWCCIGHGTCVWGICLSAVAPDVVVSVVRPSGRRGRARPADAGRCSLPAGGAGRRAGPGGLHCGG